MTRYQDHAQAPGQRIMAVRFRPGAWTSYFGIPADRITDLIVPLEDLWGAAARRLQDRLQSAGSLEQGARLVEDSLCGEAEITPIQRAIRWMEHHHGAVSMDRAAGHCGLSPRQFRRLCLQNSGLSPKFLARVFRFRHAASRLAGSQATAADLALDCGYFDQAHFINEFRAFTGRTPNQA
jgi:AraC-like DNA-binding protein